MIGFVGGGNMAEALIRGLVKEGKKNIIVSDPISERRRYLENCYGIRTTPSNINVVQSADIVILAVKPQNMREVLEEIKDVVTEKHTIVSIAAGVPLSFLQKYLKTDRLIRVMPNLAATVGEAISVLSLCECLEMKIVAPVREIFLSVGKVITLPEHYIDLVTAVSGSGPGFLCYIVEQLIELAIELGLTEDVARELVIQTFIGTAKLLDSGLPPDRIRQNVTSPGGTTDAGLKVLSEGTLRDLLKRTLEAAVKRARELSYWEE